MIANYWPNYVYPPEIGAAHRNGNLHLHDLDMPAGYCAGWSLRTLVNEGLSGIPDPLRPRHGGTRTGRATRRRNIAGVLFSLHGKYRVRFISCYCPGSRKIA